MIQFRLEFEKMVLDYCVFPNLMLLSKQLCLCLFRHNEMIGVDPLLLTLLLKAIFQLNLPNFASPFCLIFRTFLFTQGIFQVGGGVEAAIQGCFICFVIMLLELGYTLNVH